MPNPVIYNPLIKKGFQEVSDTGSIETDVAQLKNNVADLQRHKITKCLIPADLVTLETGEIFQWQGLTQTIDGTELRNGFFYKSNNGKPEVVIPAPVNYLIVENGDDVNLNNLDVKAGNYYVLGTANIPNNHVFYYLRPSAESPTPFVQYDFWFLDTLQVGTLVYRISTKEYLTVQKVDTEPALDYELIFTNGLTIRFLGYPGGNTDQLATCINEYNNDFQIISFGYGALNGGYEAVVHYNTSTSAIIDWFIMHFDGDKTYDDVIIPGTLAYTQTDTQPRLQNIANGSGGVVNITTDTNIAGNLKVYGTTSTVHAQEIESEADYIELRNGNPLGLANGERSGLEVNNYDGNGTDCILAVDKDGWARVGDSSGTLEKIATIEENPTDAQFVQYDAQNKQLKTAAIPEATTTAAGLMSSADKIKVNTIGIVYRGALLHNLSAMQSGSNLIHVHCQDFENDNIYLDCYIAAKGTTGSVSTFFWHYAFVHLDATKLDIACNINGVINVINNTGRPDTDFLLFINRLI